MLKRLGYKEKLNMAWWFGIRFVSLFANDPCKKVQGTIFSRTNFARGETSAVIGEGGNFSRRI